MIPGEQIPQFISRWMEHHDRASLPAALPEFARAYLVSDQMLAELVEYAEKQGVKKSPAEFAKCHTELQLQLKARIGKSLFGDEGLYKVLNDDDPAVEKALQVLKSGQPVAKR